MRELLILVTIRRRQRLRRHALDLAMAIRVNDVALEDHFDAQATVRFVRSERCWEMALLFIVICNGSQVGGLRSNHATGYI